MMPPGLLQVKEEGGRRMRDSEICPLVLQMRERRLKCGDMYQDVPSRITVLYKQSQDLDKNSNVNQHIHKRRILSSDQKSSIYRAQQATHTQQP